MSARVRPVGAAGLLSPSRSRPPPGVHQHRGQRVVAVNVRACRPNGWRAQRRLRCPPSKIAKPVPALQRWGRGIGGALVPKGRQKSFARSAVPSGVGACDHKRGDVGQTFLSAGEVDFPVHCIKGPGDWKVARTGRQECPPYIAIRRRAYGPDHLGERGRATPTREKPDRNPTQRGARPQRSTPRNHLARGLASLQDA